MLIVFAVVQIVTGALLWLTPGFFFTEIGPYGVRNDHYMGDLATWYLACGAALAVAVRRASCGCRCCFSPPSSMPCTRSTTCSMWARPTPAGSVLNLISLALATVLLGWMLREAAR